MFKAIRDIRQLRQTEQERQRIHDAAARSDEFDIESPVIRLYAARAKLDLAIEKYSNGGICDRIGCWLATR